MSFVEEENVRGKMAVFRRHAEDLYDRGLFPQALVAYRRLADFAALHDLGFEREQAWFWTGCCLFHEGRAEEALATFGEALKPADLDDATETAADEPRTGLRYQLLTSWIWVALHYRGKVDTIEGLLERARRYIEDRGRGAWGSRILYIRAVLLRYRGRLEEAVDLADRAVAATRQAGHDYGYVASEYLLAAASYRLDAGVADEVVLAIGRELGAGGAALPTIADARGHQVLARCALLEGRLDEAVDHARAAVQANGRTRYRVGRIQAYTVLADVLRATGALDEAREAAATALAAASGYHSELLRFEAAFAALGVEAAFLLAPGVEVQVVRDAGERAVAAARRIDPRLATSSNLSRVQGAWRSTVSPALAALGEEPGLPGD